MEDAMYCRCNNDLDNNLIFLPYVIINNNFEPILKLQTFNVGKYPTLFFNKLYIKSTNNAACSQLTPTKVKSYEDIMNHEIEAVSGEYVKIRISGDGMLVSAYKFIKYRTDFYRLTIWACITVMVLMLMVDRHFTSNDSLDFTVEQQSEFVATLRETANE